MCVCGVEFSTQNKQKYAKSYKHMLVTVLSARIQTQVESDTDKQTNRNKNKETLQYCNITQL